MCMYFPDIGTHTCRNKHSGGSTDVTMCNYVQVFFKKYLHIPTAVCVTILLYFAKIPAHNAPVSAPVSEPVSAPVSARLHHRLRGRVAVASSSHRRCIASAPHCIAARNTGDVRTSLESNLPAVQPNRHTRTEEVEPEQRALGEAMIRTQVEVMVERM